MFPQLIYAQAWRQPSFIERAWTLPGSRDTGQVSQSCEPVSSSGKGVPDAEFAVECVRKRRNGLVLKTSTTVCDIQVFNIWMLFSLLYMNDARKHTVCHMKTWWHSGNVNHVSGFSFPSTRTEINRCSFILCQRMLSSYQVLNKLDKVPVSWYSFQKGKRQMIESVK